MRLLMLLYARGRKMVFDSHAHLDDEKFDLDREEVIEKIKKAGITKVVSAGYSLEASDKAIGLAKKYDWIYATCGISPNDIPQQEEELWKTISKIEEMVNQHKKYVVAIGEIGLDYYWEKDMVRREWQRKAFKKQIEIANALELPIVIHTRDAVEDTLAILKENPVFCKGVFHCCPQNRELIKEALRLGFYISFAGPITFKNAKNAKEMVNLVPNDRLLIETDSPYLAPEPVRGTRNDPRNVQYIAQKIAEYKSLEKETIETITYKNTCQVFKIPSYL